jgi:mycobactin salicyl-AMP ligase
MRERQPIRRLRGSAVMGALARAEDGLMPAGGDPQGLGTIRLSGLLEAVAERHPRRLAFGDQPGREAWSGRPRIAWTYANAQHIVARLATFLERLGLPPGAPVGISLPNSSEACVALLAVERAGYIPCLLPVSWSEEWLGRALEAAQISAVLCQGCLADERPAETFCRLAAGYFGLRFICAFGPQVPDGVIDLDRAILDTRAEQTWPEGAGHAGFVTFEADGGKLRPLFRPVASAIAAAVDFLVSEPIAAGDRIFSLLAPDDHRGLTTGLVAALVTGATLEGQGLFDAGAFIHTLSAAEPTHLVAPAWMETVLARAGLPGNVVSTVLVHEAPVRFKLRGELKTPVTDVLAFGERACIARRRPSSGHLTFAIGDDGVAEAAAGALLRISRDEDGAISFGGSAAETFPFQRGSPQIPAQTPAWHPSGFKADLFAGVVIGVR